MRRQPYISVVPFFALLLTGIGSCSRTLDEACTRHFPHVEQEIAQIAEELGKGGRSLASLSPSSIEAREKWARRTLEETQTYIDLMYGEPEFAKARVELSHVANHLVALHGYLGHSKGKQASDVLERIRKHSLKARDLACKR